MPRFRGQGLPMHAHMTAALPFFVQANYRFSTNEPGPPLYVVLSGHGRDARPLPQRPCTRGWANLAGPLPLRLCVPDAEEPAQRLDDGWLFEDNLNAFTCAKFMHKLIDVLQVMEAGDPSGKYAGRVSLRLQVGWHVFDTGGDNAHCSSGTVMAADPTAAASFGGAGFANYAGPWSVW